MNSRNEIVSRARADRRSFPLHDAAFIHQDDRVPEISRFGEVVCHDDGGLCRRAKICFRSFCKAARTSGSSAPSGSSSRSNSGDKHERAHQTDTLALAARKFGRITIESLSWKSSERAKLAQTLLHFGFGFSEMSRP